jgi:hypothetical protein
MCLLVIVSDPLIACEVIILVSIFFIEVNAGPVNSRLGKAQA